MKTSTSEIIKLLADSIEDAFGPDDELAHRLQSIAQNERHCLRLDMAQEVLEAMGFEISLRVDGQGDNR